MATIPTVTISSMRVKPRGLEAIELFMRLMIFTATMVDVGFSLSFAMQLSRRQRELKRVAAAPKCLWRRRVAERHVQHAERQAQGNPEWRGGSARPRSAFRGCACL